MLYTQNIYSTMILDTVEQTKGVSDFFSMSFLSEFLMRDCEIIICI